MVLEANWKKASRQIVEEAIAKEATYTIFDNEGVTKEDKDLVDQFLGERTNVEVKREEEKNDYIKKNFSPWMYERVGTADGRTFDVLGGKLPNGNPIAFLHPPTWIENVYIKSPNVKRQPFGIDLGTGKYVFDPATTAEPFQYTTEPLTWSNFITGVEKG